MKYTEKVMNTVNGAVAKFGAVSTKAEDVEKQYIRKLEGTVVPLFGKPAMCFPLFFVLPLNGKLLNKIPAIR